MCSQDIVSRHGLRELKVRVSLMWLMGGCRMREMQRRLSPTLCAVLKWQPLNSRRTLQVCDILLAVHGSCRPRGLELVDVWNLTRYRSYQTLVVVCACEHHSVTTAPLVRFTLGGLELCCFGLALVSEGNALQSRHFVNHLFKVAPCFGLIGLLKGLAGGGCTAECCTVSTSVVMITSCVTCSSCRASVCCV